MSEGDKINISLSKAAVARVQIDKICDMALHEESSEKYLRFALETIRAINADSGSFRLDGKDDG